MFEVWKSNKINEEEDPIEVKESLLERLFRPGRYLKYDTPICSVKNNWILDAIKGKYESLIEFEQFTMSVYPNLETAEDWTKFEDTVDSLVMALTQVGVTANEARTSIQQFAMGFDLASAKDHYVEMEKTCNTANELRAKYNLPEINRKEDQ